MLKLVKWDVYAVSPLGVREQVGHIEGTPAAVEELEWLTRDHAELWAQEWASWPLEFVVVG
jgi:hypothetical protein